MIVANVIKKVMFIHNSIGETLRRTAVFTPFSGNLTKVVC